MKTSFLSSIAYSFSFVFITDLTDKSVFLIILLSQKLPSLILFIVSLFSVLLMNCFSILVGCYIPKLISLEYLEIIACFLFITFGIISIYESIKKESKVKDLIEETKKELNDSEENNNYILMNEESETNYESSTELSFHSILKTKSNTSEISINNNSIINDPNNEINTGLIIAIILMLCLSDFGDKSQIAVITMAAIYDLYGVLIGSSLALLGTVTIAVLFGAWICDKISPKILLFIGGILFLIFGFEVLINILFKF